MVLELMRRLKEERTKKIKVVAFSITERSQLMSQARKQFLFRCIVQRRCRIYRICVIFCIRAPVETTAELSPVKPPAALI